MLDWSAALSSLVAQAPLAALVVALVYFALKREIEKVRIELRSEISAKSRKRGRRWVRRSKASNWSLLT